MGQQIRRAGNEHQIWELGTALQQLHPPPDRNPLLRQAFDPLSIRGNEDTAAV
jgi:hypothetical protein